MQYDISLRISYTYDEPVTSGRQVLQLMPAELPGEQRLIAGRLDIEPQPDEWHEGRDFWNNACVNVVHRSAQMQIEYAVRARVERLRRTSAGRVPVRLDRLAQEIESYRTLDAESPHHFVTASPRVPIDSEIAAYTRQAISDRMTVVEAVEALGMRLHTDIEYDPDATEVHTPVKEAFQQRRGVCQDFSHIMIAGLRSAGIPAAYVSGYLRTRPPEGKPRLEGADAMHAWVRAWCGQTSRWVDFDPTNAVHVAMDHIVVARGRDYSDISPISGVLRTSGSQETEQAVDVVPLD